jgi:4-hydroxy-3-methylbut-2-en-1-yl diphosphate reductase
MFIDIDSDSGFCYGVVKTIQLAEDALNQGKPVYCLGEIVHNEEEVKRLQAKGLIIIEKDELTKVENSTVLIRAHGEPPATYQKIAGNANTLRDGTCPIVLQLQKKVKTAWESIKTNRGQVVIYGKQGHAEVEGLAGQANNEAIIISNISDIEKIDFSRPVALFAQTTQSVEGLKEIENILRQRMLPFHPEDALPLTITDSICRHVSRRGEHLKLFAKKYDVVVFVSGTHSSNGKVLFEICSKNNPSSYWVPQADDVKAEWFASAQSVGICGATSTPRWLMEEVAKKIETLVVI